jgi:hypothetical protein
VGCGIGGVIVASRGWFRRASSASIHWTVEALKPGWRDSRLRTAAVLIVTVPAQQRLYFLLDPQGQGALRGEHYAAPSARRPSSGTAPDAGDGIKRVSRSTPGLRSAAFTFFAYPRPRSRNRT